MLINALTELPKYLSQINFNELFYPCDGRPNFWQNIRKFWNMQRYGGWRRSPLKLANSIKTYSKNQWMPPVLWKFTWIMRELLKLRCEFKKINVRVLVYWKSLKILKEIKKHSGKFLRVWAKNQWRIKFLRQF